MSQTTPQPTARPKLRCAIYTRKSTEAGLEQEFNSLHNQREAAEAYIKSQAHEGWSLVPGAYDDGGLSGGSLERPALQQLLAEVRAGRVDVIVVYKVDRLTRSLSDFAKLVELFDAHGVSFVSVTQAFNTTTSMGRLTLNVLLSFAQFEREVTAERIRDKVAASKRKGLRVGGPVPLGYMVKDKKLVPHAQEAETVRLIFRQYLELGCLSALLADLKDRAIVTKLSPRRHGLTRGGIVFTRGPLAFLLRNRAYIGDVVHKGRHYRGEHAPIVPPELFEAVQTALSAQAQRTDRPNLGIEAPLRGVLQDQHGRRMVPTTANKRGVRYRYYVTSAQAQVQGGADIAPTVRVPAPELEAVVFEALGIAAPTEVQAISQGDPEEAPAPSLAERIGALVDTITLRADTVVITFKQRDGDVPLAPLRVPWTAKRSRRHRAVIGVEESPPVRPIRAETRARLLDGIAKARAWLDDLTSGRVADTKALASREGCSERHIRMTLNLGFLSPAIVKAAVEGTLPDGTGVVHMTELPPCWQAQWHGIV